MFFCFCKLVCSVCFSFASDLFVFAPVNMCSISTFFYHCFYVYASTRPFFSLLQSCISSLIFASLFAFVWAFCAAFYLLMITRTRIASYHVFFFMLNISSLLMFYLSFLYYFPSLSLYFSLLLSIFLSLLCSPGGDKAFQCDSSFA